MLRAITICPDAEVAGQFKEAVAGVGGVFLSRALNQYPNEMNLTRLVRATCPELVFLSVESLERSLEVASTLEEIAPGVQIVALSRTRDAHLLESLIHSEIREFLQFPVCEKKLQEAVTRAQAVLARKPLAIASTDLLYSFLPSKAGVGASTIALNISVAMSRVASGRVLLTDLDLNSGVLHFLMKQEPPYSVLDAAIRAEELDEDVWPELVHAAGNLDLLPAGEFNAGARIDPEQVHQVFDFARRHYKAIIVDLSGNLEQYSIEVMRESKRIFLVCSPEFSSVHLARRKHQLLRKQDLGDRVSLVLNRAETDATIPTAEIEEIVGLPVSFSFPNDCRGVLDSVFRGKAVDEASKLGRQFALFARSILGMQQEEADSRGLGDKLSSWLTSRSWKSVAVPERR